MKDKSIVILGNGFDLNLGLKSSFKDFYKSKYSPFNDQQAIFKELNEEWNDLENFIKKQSDSYSLITSLGTHPGVRN